jgi:hypothetical protein
MSQTDRNPSIISFFIALGNKNGAKGVTIREFETLWKSRIMNKHDRFKCCVDDTGNRYFKVSLMLLIAQDILHSTLAQYFHITSHLLVGF